MSTSIALPILLIAIVGGLVVLAAVIVTVVMLTRKKSAPAYQHTPTGYMPNPAPQGAAFCPQCGDNLVPDSVYCQRCGYRVK